MHILSELRKVTWHLPLELWEVARDRRHVEAPEDRFLGLAVEQEPEGRLETAFGRMPPRRQPLAHLSRHGDVVTSLAFSFADDHLENERVVRGSAPDLNHVDLLGDVRVLRAPVMIHITRISDFSVFRPSWSIVDSRVLADQPGCQWDAILPDLKTSRMTLCAGFLTPA